MLIIADGWGARDESWGNLIAAADTPVMDQLQVEWPTTRLLAAGKAVGMPEGTVGNSEAGHLHIGGGRRFLSDRVRIEEAIADGSFSKNEALLWAMRGAKRDKTRLHLLGIISFYSSHGSVEHLKALMRLAADERVPQVFIHGMLGRRGERPESGAIYVQDIEQEAERLGLGQFVSLIGRFWSLDREENWDLNRQITQFDPSLRKPVRSHHSFQSLVGDDLGRYRLAHLDTDNADYNNASHY